MSIFFEKHAPKTFSELVFPDNVMAGQFERYVKGFSFGHILMHGPHGCGKTTIAKMLPEATIPGIDENDVLFLHAAKDANVNRIRDLADGFMHCLAHNDKGRLFLILDEVDTLSAETKTVLRGALDKHAKHLMVILTSNDLSKVDPGIRDRCEVFNFSGGRPATYFPLALRILRKEGLSVPQAELDEVVKHHCGSLRQLIRAMEAVIYGIRAKYNEAA